MNHYWMWTPPPADAFRRRCSTHSPSAPPTGLQHLSTTSSLLLTAGHTYQPSKIDSPPSQPNYSSQLWQLPTRPDHIPGSPYLTAAQNSNCTTPPSPSWSRLHLLVVAAPILLQHHCLPRVSHYKIILGRRNLGHMPLIVERCYLRCWQVNLGRLNISVWPDDWAKIFGHECVHRHLPHRRAQPGPPSLPDQIGKLRRYQHPRGRHASGRIPISEALDDSSAQCSKQPVIPFQVKLGPTIAKSKNNRNMWILVLFIGLLITSGLKPPPHALDHYGHSNLVNRIITGGSDTGLGIDYLVSVFIAKGSAWSENRSKFFGNDSVHRVKLRRCCLVEVLSPLHQHFHPPVGTKMEHISQNRNLILDGLPTDLPTMVKTAISQITLPLFDTSDNFLWLQSDTGLYTVKSGYHFINALLISEQQWNLTSTSTTASSSIWKMLWKAKFLPKIRMFVWNCCNKGLALGQNLHSRILSFNPKCHMCLNANETWDHPMWACRFAHRIWFGSVFDVSPLSTIGSTVAEELACRAGLLLARSRSQEHHIMYTDSMVLLDQIHSSSKCYNSVMFRVIQDICFLLNNMYVSICAVTRSDVRLTHKFVTAAADVNVSGTWAAPSFPWFLRD